MHSFQSLGLVLLTAIWILLAVPNKAIAQTLPNGPRLKDVSRPGLAIGGVLHGYDELWQKPDYLLTADREFNAITATAYMAYGAWPDGLKQPDTTGFENVVDWATSHNKRVHGHVLLYPKANEDLEWLEKFSDEHFPLAIQHYVTKMAGVRRGKIWVWDVVNEVMADDGEAMDANGLRTGYREYKRIGPDYVAQAFRWAKQADPDALLIINDYGAEALNNKSNRLFTYAQSLRDEGVPIDGVGFQMHLLDTKNEPYYTSIERNLRRFSDAGFGVYITELDVSADTLPNATSLPNAERLKRQKRIYEQIALIADRIDRCEALLLWDFADNYSWLHPSIVDFPELPKDHYSFPTPFFGGNGETIIPKPAYYGLQSGLQAGLPSDAPPATPPVEKASF